MSGSELVIATGTRIPYHVTPRYRLAVVTADMLRGAAVRLPPGSLAQEAPWALTGHLRLSSDARFQLPPIMGGLSLEVGYDVSAGSRAALLRAAERCPDRRALYLSTQMDTMGFATAARSPPLHVADLGDGHSGGEEASEGASEGQRRGSDGRFVAPADNASPTRTLFNTTGGGGMGDARGSQASIKTIRQNREAHLQACARITQMWGRFPGIRQSLLRKAGCLTACFDIGDFPAVVLSEVADEMDSQYGAYLILRESARVASTLGGTGGAFAVMALGDDFDFTVSTAIDSGEITLDSTPEEVLLGALPILSAALFLWFREHVPAPRAVPEVVLAAQGLDLCRGGSFNLLEGLNAFYHAYGAAEMGNIPYSVELVYQAIARAVSVTVLDPGAARFAISDDDGTPRLLWTTFAANIQRTYCSREAAAVDGGGPVFTKNELRVLVTQLRNFTRAQCMLTSERAALAAAPLYPGGGGGGAAVRLVPSEPRDYGALLAAAVGAMTAQAEATTARQDAMAAHAEATAARQDASLAAMMAVVMRAHTPGDQPASAGGPPGEDTSRRAGRGDNGHRSGGGGGDRSRADGGHRSGGGGGGRDRPGGGGGGGDSGSDRGGGSGGGSGGGDRRRRGGSNSRRNGEGRGRNGQDQEDDTPVSPLIPRSSAFADGLPVGVDSRVPPRAAVPTVAAATHTSILFHTAWWLSPSCRLWPSRPSDGTFASSGASNAANCACRASGTASP